MADTNDPRQNELRGSAFTWWSLLSLASANVGTCGGLGTIVIGYIVRYPVRGNTLPAGPAEIVFVFLFAAVLAAGVAFAGLGIRRREGQRVLPVASMIFNFIFLCPYLYIGVYYSIDAVRFAEEKAEAERRLQEADIEHRKHVWLRLGQVSLETSETLELLRLNRRGFPAGKEGRTSIGSARDMAPSGLGKYDQPEVKAFVTWPEPRRFELTIEFDNPNASLKIDMERIEGRQRMTTIIPVDAKATCNQQPIDLPIDLPAGKYKIVLVGRCP